MAQTVNNLPEMQETQVLSLVWEDPWKREWQPTTVFLPEETHGQRSLAGYISWSCRGLGTTNIFLFIRHLISLHIIMLKNIFLPIICLNTITLDRR